MKQFLLLLTVMMLVASCGLSPATATAKATVVETQTAIPIDTATAALTPTPAATLTHTPPAPTATPTLEPTATEIPLPDNYKFVFQGQPPESEANYRAAITNAYRYLRSLGVTETGPFTLFAFADLQQYREAAMEYYQQPAWWVEQRLNFGSHYGTHGPGVIWHWTETANYQNGLKHGWLDWGAGEYMDGVLLQLAGIEDIISPQPQIPAWLIQGSEIYLMARMSDDGANGKFAAVRAQNITEERIHPSRNGLLEAEHYGENIEHGRLGFWALDYLGQHYGGDTKIIEWHRAFKDRLPGETWRDAFQKVYGVSLSDFYQAFAEYRKVHYPTIYTVSGVTGILTTTAGESAKDIWVFPCPESPTFDCVPVENDPGDDCSCFGEIVPVTNGETLNITIAFAHTAEPASIFGYYAGNGAFTPDKAKAAVIPLSSGQQFNLGTLQLPEAAP